MKNTKYPYIITAYPHFASWGDGAYLAPFCEAKTQQLASEPLAELIYGGYPESASMVQNIKPALSLHQLLHRESETLLDKNQVKELQFMLKLFAIKKPQSLHYHPNQAEAQAGFRKESLEQRSLKDRFFHDHHAKYEIIYSLQDHLSLFAGFLPAEVIVERLELLGVKSILKDATLFMQKPDEENLKNLLIHLLNYDKRQQEIIINQIIPIAEDYQEFYPYYQQILHLHRHFSDNIAIILPLFLRDYHLAKGEALIIRPNTPHTILEGVGINLSSASQNSIRLALTHKHHNSKAWHKTNYLAPTLINHDLHNPDLALPDDLPLHLQVVSLENTFFINGKNPPLILLAIKGKARLSSAPGNRYHSALEVDDLPLTRGEAIFLPNNAGGYQLEGRGLFVLAWSQLND